MELIKKIVKEELKKAISILEETDLYKSLGVINTSKDPKNNIIYDYQAGRAFAGNNLESDIANLNRYHLVDYLPKSEESESWSFEFNTVQGTILIIDIERVIINNTSVWSMKFGQLYKGEAAPTLIAELLEIPGYSNFINSVNKKIAGKIDPSNF